ncbi:MAG: element excision factor XisH family protein [Saprospiraceae bacterium]
MAKDIIHEIVKSILIKEGWTIIADPLHISMENTPDLYIDLTADKIIIAENKTEKIAVEVKSFVGKSAQTSFYHALGQFILYRTALQDFDAERVVYLGVPSDIWDTLLKKEFYQKVIRQTNLKIILFDIQNQKSIRWIK